MTGAAIASAVVGAGSLAKGVSDGNKAEDAMNASIGSAEEMQRYLRQLGLEGVETAQGMLDDWEGTFGGIQDNLSEYYNNLDPDKFSTQNKSMYKQHMDKQMQQFNDSMASTGLQSAGMKQQALQESAFQTAEGNAGIDIMAPEQVNQMKQGFLNFGEGQRNSANNAMQNALSLQSGNAQAGSTNLQNAYGNQAGQYGQSSAGYMGAAGSMFGSAIGLGIEGFGGSGGAGNTWDDASRGITWGGKGTGVGSDWAKLPVLG